MKNTAATQSGKSLVIVESPAKARTIGKFLGGKFTVEASIGHVRDLPQGAKEIPEEYKGQAWAYLGVNIRRGLQADLHRSRRQEAAGQPSSKALKEADALYLATDEDREGEAISWHLLEMLKPKVPVHRLVFHEITQEAIEEALAELRATSTTRLVRAQETRRILDRLYGYDVSQLLWKKVRPRALGRARAERGRPAHRGPRAGADGVRLRHLLGSARATFADPNGAEFRGRTGLGRRPAGCPPARISTRRPAS